jgi:hypothetical protein
VRLEERLVAIHAALDAARVPHAFGGAIALAYWTGEPRGTRDLDLNVFLAPAEAPRVRDGLPEGVAWDAAADAAIARDGQARVLWDGTPIDLFFAYADIHEMAARSVERVPFRDGVIPVLAPLELAIFKAHFDRTRDWADIEDMLRAGTLEADALRRAIVTMLGGDDARLARLAQAERAAGDA